jgi:hypothetical protein
MQYVHVICEQALNIDATETDGESIVGDESHINAKQHGPRCNEQKVGANVDANENFSTSPQDAFHG